MVEPVVPASPAQIARSRLPQRPAQAVGERFATLHEVERIDGLFQRLHAAERQRERLHRRLCMPDMAGHHGCVALDHLFAGCGIAVFHADGAGDLLVPAQRTARSGLFEKIVDADGYHALPSFQMIGSMHSRMKSPCQTPSV